MGLLQEAVVRVFEDTLPSLELELVRDESASVAGCKRDRWLYEGCWLCKSCTNYTKCRTRAPAAGIGIVTAGMQFGVTGSALV